MSGSLWSFVTILGPIILIVVIGYALWNRRSLTRHEKVQQHEAVEDLYRGGQGGVEAPPVGTPPKPSKDG